MNIFIIIVSISILSSGISAANYYKVTSQIYLDIEHDGKPLERITIGLFGEIAPNAVENFRVICLDGIDGKTYVGSEFHRIIDRFMVQGGDIISGDGRGSISIYGKYFDDENMDKVNHTRGGFVAMANRGPNTNGCQFYITTMPAPWLNGKHTVFGIVVDGQSTVHFIEKVKTDTDDYPVNSVKIVDCGDVPIEEPFEISDSLFDVWGWIKAAIIPLGMSFCILGLFQWMIQKL